MFRCAEPGYVGALYRAAGLTDITEWDVAVELVTRSPEQYWDLISEHVSLVATTLRQVDSAARERVRADVLTAVRPYEQEGMVRVPGAARCSVATKPSDGRGR
jgi:ABC-type iron transport system FetAB permease component